MSMKNRVVLITGGTDGIGKAVVSQLARTGAKIYLTGRNETKGEEAVREIAAGAGDADLEFIRADLSSLQGARDLADTFRTREQRLDVLINNVGAHPPTRVESLEGIEQMLVVNHLSPLVLTANLAALLKRSSDPRIIFAGSGAMAMGKVQMDDLEFRKRKYSIKTYASAKLVNYLVVQELAQRWKDSGIKVYMLDPGFTRTPMTVGISKKLLPLPLRMITSLLTPHAPEVGAKPHVHLATVEPALPTGAYLDHKLRPVSPHRLAADSDLRRSLFERTEAYLKQVDASLANAITDAAS